MNSVIVVIEDLFFLAKVQHTAQQAGIEMETVALDKLRERLRRPPARGVIVDLNHKSGNAVDAIRDLKSDAESVQVLGFLSHVQGDLARDAREAGCDFVLARSAFSQELSSWLTKLASL